MLLQKLIVKKKEAAFRFGPHDCDVSSCRQCHMVMAFSSTLPLTGYSWPGRGENIVELGAASLSRRACSVTSTLFFFIETVVGETRE
jgi:hypothetical protein